MHPCGAWNLPGAVEFMTKRTRNLRRQRSDDGTVTVEFALLIPLALLFVGFILALGMRTLWAGFAEDAARSLARYGSIRTATGDYPSRPALVTRSGSLLGGILGTPTISMNLSRHGDQK